MIHRCIDPVALALTAPGAPFETVASPRGDLFRNFPDTLSGVYRHAMAFGPRRMLQTDTASFSYDDIFARAGRLARALAGEFGVRPGDYVAMAMLNGPDWMASFIAVTAAGAAAVMVNTRCAPEEMVHAIGQTGATLLIADRERATVLRGQSDALEWRMILAGAPDLVRAYSDADLMLILDGGDAVLDPVARDPGDPAIVLFTSGTTGHPKAVRIDHGAISHVVAIAGLAGAIQDRRFAMETGREVPVDRGSAGSATVIAGPVFHFSGIMPFLRGMYFGAPMFVLSKWNAEVALELMEREPLTRLGFVPTMLSDMLASPKSGPHNLGTVMVLSSGSATLDLTLVDRVKAAVPSVMIANTYGQTESCAWISTICGQDYLEHPSSIGYVMPTVEVRIVRDDGGEAGVEEHGEIWMRGAGMMHGYIGNPDATADTIRDGWLRTGDNGWFDAGERLYLADRRKNMVISGGENIYCAEVERVLGEHPDVAEVIAYGRPDDRLGERIAATVVPRPGRTVDVEALRQYARGRLAGYKVPRDIAVRAVPLPRTPTQKVDRGGFLRDLENDE